MGNDKGGVEQDEDKDDQHKSKSSPLPHPRVTQTIQHDHLVNNILSAIEKVVTTRSHVATFCKHYSFVSSFEPFKVEDCHTQFLHQNQVLVVCMTQDQLFHTYGQKGS
jgi:hypothetical protein